LQKRVAGIVLLLCLALAGSQKVAAQLPEVKILSDQMAQVLSDAKFQRVAVVDFYGPGEGISNLGVTLADRFDEDLRKTAVGPMIQDRGQMGVWLKSKNWPLSVLNSIDVSLWVASQLNIDAIITGNITSTEREFKVEASLYRVDTRQWIKSFEMLSRISPESQALATTFPESEYKFDPGIAVAGQNGYGLPTCLSCPAAPYNDDALRHHTQGSVLLTAVIGADGIPEKLTVRQAMPDGLTDIALETVSTWKFSPANGPDGKPATVQHTIRVTFHFSHGRPNHTQPSKPHS
jgi:TonB family protein